MRILLVAIQYPPSIETGAKRPGLLAKEFRRLGHSVTVLSQWERAEGSKKFTCGLGEFGERVLRLAPCPIPGIGDASFRLFWRLKSLISKICRHRKFDAAILTGPPFFHFLLVPILTRMRVPTILDYRDGWATDPYPFRGAKDRVARLVGKFAEPMLFRRASAAVFISNALRADHLSLVGSRDRKKAFVVPNGVDAEEFAKAPSVSLKSLLGFPADTNLIVYVGTLSPDIGADHFARNLNRILRRGARQAKFVFVGQTVEYSRYFDPEILDVSVRFLPPVPLTTAYGYMKAADILLSLGGSEAQRLNRKIFEYAAASKPVLHVGNPMGETAKVVREHRLGTIIAANDEAALEKGLQAILSSPADGVGADPCGKNLPFTTKQGAERYVDIIVGLARKT